jgi:uncharacterized membrane protein
MNSCLKLHCWITAKTISWRIWATLITFLITYFVVGDVKTGLKIGLTDTLIKLVIYYAHDFIWMKSKCCLPEQLETNENIII